MEPRSILVIDSSADSGEALCALLGAWGQRATSVDTGRRGLELALRDAPEIIVVDLGLPDLDGCRVVQLIRAESAGDVPAIIAYSGYHHREHEALRAGCDAFVLKPNVEELESLVGLSRADMRKYAAYAGPATSRRPIG